MRELCPNCGNALDWRWRFGDIGYEAVYDPCPICSAVGGRTVDELLALIGRAASKIEDLACRTETKDSSSTSSSCQL